jgi:hypothetical protein
MTPGDQVASNAAGCDEPPADAVIEYSPNGPLGDTEHHREKFLAFAILGSAAFIGLIQLDLQIQMVREILPSVLSVLLFFAAGAVTVWGVISTASEYHLLSLREEGGWLHDKVENDYKETPLPIVAGAGWKVQLTMRWAMQQPTKWPTQPYPLILWILDGLLVLGLSLIVALAWVGVAASLSLSFHLGGLPTLGLFVALYVVVFVSLAGLSRSVQK